MRAMRSGSASLAVMALAACSGISTQSDYDMSYDFGSASSYNWMPGGSDGDLQFYERTLQEAVDSEMAARGLRKAPAGEADLLFAYHTGTQTRQQYDTYGYGAGGWWGGYWGGGMTTTTTTVREYEEGTLILDIVDRARNQLVWRGSGTKTLDSSATPEERHETLRKAVNKILADFPPGS